MDYKALKPGDLIKWGRAFGEVTQINSHMIEIRWFDREENVKHYLISRLLDSFNISHVKDSSLSGFFYRQVG